MRLKSSLFVGITVLLGMLLFGYLHEQVHVEINKSYGIESKVEYLSHFPDFVTIPERPCLPDNCRLAHNLTDAIGYHLLVLYAVFGYGLFVIVLILELNLLLKVKELGNAQ